MIVVDASVAIKWFLPEIGSDAAQRLATGNNQLIAPDLLLLEVMKALWKNHRKQIIDRDTLIKIPNLLEPAFARLVPLTDFWRRASELSLELNHPIYDCVYLALAEAERCSIVTFDRRLLAVAARLPNVTVLDMATI